MKKIIICTVLILSGITIGTYARGGQPSAARNTSVTVVSDTTENVNDPSTSDETAETDDPLSIQAQMDSAMQQAFGQNDTNGSNNDDSVSSLFWNSKGAPKYALVALLIIFGFPVLLVAIILYFVYRNKKARYEYQKAALEKGINPNMFYNAGDRTATSGARDAAAETLDMSPTTNVTPNERLWEKGIKEMCMGIGLAIFLGVLCDESLSVIGILVFFMGLGKIIISKTRKNTGISQTSFDVNQRYDTANTASEDPTAENAAENAVNKDINDKDSRDSQN